MTTNRALFHLGVVSVLLVVTGCHGDAATGDGGSSGDALDAGVGHYVNDTFMSAQGQRDWKAWIPSGYRDGSAVPMVVVLHGCGQQTADIENTSQYTKLAEARTFIVVYPQQAPSANSLGCWNWFLGADQERDQGEPAIIAGIAQNVMSRFTIDPKRVYVIGLSSGAAMTVILGATYPDVFAAIGVVAGCEYEGEPCEASGGPDPAKQGQIAYQAMGTRARVMPTLVFHGDADSVVLPINGQQVTAQWVATDDWADNGAHDGSLPAAATSTSNGQVPNGGRSYTVSDWAAHGATLVESWVIHGANHAWPGGAPGGSYTDPLGPDATTLSYDFFLAHPAP
jgi:poly(hydroxyalkanoate) depolymerase family esterase